MPGPELVHDLETIRHFAVHLTKPPNTLDVMPDQVQSIVGKNVLFVYELNYGQSTICSFIAGCVSLGPSKLNLFIISLFHHVSVNSIAFILPSITTTSHWRCFPGRSLLAEVSRLRTDSVSYNRANLKVTYSSPR